MSFHKMKRGLWAVRKRLADERRLRKNRFAPILNLPPLENDTLNTAKNIRGTDRPPAIMLHGVMPRSGTTLVGELLRLHPDLCAYPNELWEVPFLRTTNRMIQVQEAFFDAYKHNIARMGRLDFLPLFGASIVAYLHASVEPSKRLLVKTPDVQYLSYFHHVFPFESLLLVLRDGRDVVHSTLKTWPGSDFALICKTWNAGARLILELSRHRTREDGGFWVAKFEDAVGNPARFMEEVCERFDLDETKYPFDGIGNVPVRGSSQPAKGEVSWEGEQKPKGFNPIGRWKEWPGKWKETFKKIAGNSLVRTGYSKDMSW